MKTLIYMAVAIISAGTCKANELTPNIGQIFSNPEDECAFQLNFADDNQITLTVVSKPYSYSCDAEARDRQMVSEGQTLISKKVSGSDWSNTSGNYIDTLMGKFPPLVSVVDANTISVSYWEQTSFNSHHIISRTYTLDPSFDRSHHLFASYAEEHTCAISLKNALADAMAKCRNAGFESCHEVQRGPFEPGNGRRLADVCYMASVVQGSKSK